MSAGAQIDYEALAKQNGAVSSTPASASGGVDYEALAKQHGAVSSTPAPQEGFGQSFLATMPGGGAQLSDLWEGPKQMAAHPLDSLKMLVQAMAQSQQEVAEKGESRMAQPGLANKATGALQWLESGIPVIGPMMSKAGEQFGAGNVSGGLGTTAGAATNVFAPGMVAKAPGAIADVASGVRPTAQRYFNIGPELTEDAIAKAQATTEATEARLQEKLAAARQANTEARAAAMQKQQLMGEIQGHAQDLTNQLVNLKQAEIVKGKAMYPQIDGAAEPLAIRNIVSDAIEKNIRGTDKPPSMLGQMLKDLEPEDPLSQASVFRGAGVGGRQLGAGNLADLPPEVRSRMMAQLSEPERAMYQPPPPSGTSANLPFEQLHGYATELGEELSRDLSGDERAAITQTRNGILDVMRKMADEEGKLGQFQAAQKNWSQLENTFNKTWADRRGVASPIAKALASKDPVSGQVIPERVASILLKDDNYKLAQTMLGRYGQTGSDVLQLIKEKAQQITTLPKSLKEEPVGPTMAKIAQLQSMPLDVDPQALKAKALHETALGLRSMKGIRGALDIVSLLHFATSGNPLGLAYPALRRGLSYGLDTEAAKGFLTKPTAAEKIAASKVYKSRTAAKGKP